MPTEEEPPFVPFTCQVTAVFVVFATVAVNCAVEPAGTAVADDETKTDIGGGAGLVGEEIGVLLPQPETKKKTEKPKAKLSSEANERNICTCIPI